LKLLLIFLLSLGSCGLVVTRPKLEMSYAAAAFLAARKVGSAEKTPNLYRKAEFFYLKAKSSYKRKSFNKAKEYAIQSRKFSEQAEYITVRKQTLERYE